MKIRLISILFWALTLHLIVSFAFIFHLPLFSGTRLSTLFKTYVMPGPFFIESRIVDNYSISISWKMNGTWMSPVDPAKENFDQYHTSLNPADLYGNRLCRTLYFSLMLPDSSGAEIKNRKEFKPLKQFLYDRYIPVDVDSVKMWIINNRAENFSIKTDSVYIAISR